MKATDWKDKERKTMENKTTESPIPSPLAGLLSRVDALWAECEKATPNLYVYDPHDKRMRLEVRSRRDDCQPLVCEMVNHRIGTCFPPVIERDEQLATARLFASSRTNYPAALDAVRALAEALGKIGAETTELAMRLPIAERLEQSHIQVDAMAREANSALASAARLLGVEGKP